MASLPIIALISLFGLTTATFFKDPATTSTTTSQPTYVDEPIQRLLVCQSIDSVEELQRLASAVQAMEKKQQQQQQQDKYPEKSPEKSDKLNLKKVKETLTTMMTTLAYQEATTPYYGSESGSTIGYPRYFFANMTGDDKNLNGNLFPMEIDSWYQPAKPSRPAARPYAPVTRPRPAARPRPRTRPVHYRRPAARRPMTPQGPIMKQGMNRLGPRSLENDANSIDTAFISLMEPLRPAIRQFLHIAREEQEILDHELEEGDYVDYEDEESHEAPHHTRSVEQPEEKKGIPNTHRYAAP